MIYQERFTESEIQAVNTLIKECNWAAGTEDYLVAYMKLLSDINPKFIKRRYKNRNPVAGYFALPLERLHKAAFQKLTYQGYTTAARLINLKPEEQILWHKKVFYKNCSTLEDVTDSILGLPFKSPLETKVYNTQLAYLPQYMPYLEISKKDVIADIRGIINGAKLD